jgi:hypothetical protein
MTIAIENPPKAGECRVFNQLDEVYGVGELALMVSEVGKEKFGLKTSVSNIEDPRIEMQDHFYSLDNQHLMALGFKPSRTLLEELEIMLADCLKYKSRIGDKRERIAPTITWKEGCKQGGPLGHSCYEPGRSFGRRSGWARCHLKVWQTPGGGVSSDDFAVCHMGTKLGSNALILPSKKASARTMSDS